jgi:hypothetical protein
LIRFRHIALLLFVVASFAEPLLASPRGDRLFPASTRLFISVIDAPRMSERWDATQIGQLLEDPVIQPFVEDLKQQLRSNDVTSHIKLGLTVEDLRNVAAAEMAVGMMVNDNAELSAAAMVDITGNRAKTDELLKKVNQTLLDQKADRSSRTIEGVEVVIYDLPRNKKMGSREQRAVYAIKDDTLLIADELGTITTLLQRWAAPMDGSLASVEGFQKVMARCEQDATDESPDVRWFIDPFRYAEAMQGLKPEGGAENEDRPLTSVDLLEALKSTGFEALRAAGGYLYVQSGPYEMLNRTAIYAPGPFEKSMQMLDFPNSEELIAQDWIPRKLAHYATFNVDIREAFKHIGPIFDATIGEGEKGVWLDVLDSLKNDPNGPGIDMEKDLIAHLGTRCSVVIDYVEPIEPTSERMLLAVETTNEKALAESIRKSMETDPAVVKRKFGDIIVWEIIEEAIPNDELPEVLIEGLDDIPQPSGTPTDKQGKALPSSAVAVANGHLFISSHADFLQKILTERSDLKSLAHRADYQRVMSHVEKLSGGKSCFRVFTRTDEALRPNYELMKAGRMGESQMLMGSMLNRLLGNGPEGEPRQQQVDGSKMPEFQVLRRYLGPGGGYLVTEDAGWYAVGFFLPRNSGDEDDPVAQR